MSERDSLDPGVIARTDLTHITNVTMHTRFAQQNKRYLLSQSDELGPQIDVRLLQVWWWWAVVACRCGGSGGRGMDIVLSVAVCA